MILALLGCLDEVFEAPYILVSGLGPSTGMSFHEGTIRVATTKGALSVDGNGVVTPTGQRALHVDGPYTLEAGMLTGKGHEWKVGDAVDLLARADGAWVHFDNKLEWYADNGGRDTIGDLPCGRRVATGPKEHPYVLCADRVYDAVHPDPPVVTGLVAGRALAFGPDGRLYVVQGDPPAVYRVEPDGRLQLIARFVGDVVDMAFGTGGLLPPENLYLLRAGGQLDYLRPP